MIVLAAFVFVGFCQIVQTRMPFLADCQEESADYCGSRGQCQQDGTCLCERGFVSFDFDSFQVNSK